MSESLKVKTITSVVWSAIERFSVQGIQFLLTIIVARLISPFDYGLVAMLGIFLAIAQTFIDSGFSNALIQKKDRTEIDFSTVFYFNIVVGLVVYWILYISAPYIADFYDEPQLDIITKVISLSLVINSLSVIQRTKLTIILNFRIQAIISLISVIVSGSAGIFLAYMGYGVWAIIAQTLLNALLNTVFLWLFTKWIPLFCFSIASFRTLFSFGSKLLFSGLLHTIYTNLYNLIIGKNFSSAELGYYNRAYTLAYFPSSNLGNILIRAIFPILCDIQDDDKRFSKLFIESIKISAFIVFPVMICLCVLAKPIVLIVLTEKWLPIVLILQILCIAYMWEPVMVINNIVLKAKGRSDYFLKAEVLKKTIGVLIMFITFPLGLNVICIGLIIYALADFVVTAFYVYKVTECSFICQFKALLPIIFLNMSMGGVVYISTLLFHFPLLKLIMGFSIGIVYYLLVSNLMRFSVLVQMKNLFNIHSNK